MLAKIAGMKLAIKETATAIATIIRNWDEIESIELLGNNDDGYTVSIGMKASNVFGD